MAYPLRFLVANSETPKARDKRRDSVGSSSGETYVERLRALVPDAQIDLAAPVDDRHHAPDHGALADYDAVFLTGSPLHLYEDTPETRRAVEFMRAVFASGTPSFGSCAGLQVATVAAGGTVRPRVDGHEAAFARRITRTEAGRGHPLLEGRPAVFDALAIHTDEVETLPGTGRELAFNAESLQAAEIRLDGGVFWGVQYHPELTLAEIAAAIRREADDLVQEGFADSRQILEVHADLIEALDRAPERRDLAWRLALDREVTDPDRRRRELRNFIELLVKPTASARGRA